jgi:hypothetical protein
MGISASIMCNCYREGKTTPCPFPDEFVADPTAMPALNWQNPPSEDEAEEAYAELRQWLARCCPHPNMNFANEFIASWKGYQTFSDALEALGADDFPHLMRQLPDGEDGITPATIAQAMLSELDNFEKRQTDIKQAILVDSERNEIISMGSQVLRGTLAMDRNSGFDIGFTEEGFFVRDRWELNRVVFLAQRVEQRLLRPEQLQVDYVDLDTGRSFACNTPFGKSFIGEDGLPRMVFRQFHVELRASTENRFAYLTNPLRRALQASITTGNPIRWA